jgi:hypothetical protein
MGHLSLADDEAFVITVDPAGASYHSVTIHDHWFVVPDMAGHTTSLNCGQAVANADGSYTYVVARADPHIHNWIDTVGLRNVLILIRIQGIVGDRVGSIRVAGRLTKLDALADHLPRETIKIGDGDRQKQIRERRLECGLRFVDR